MIEIPTFSLVLFLKVRGHLPGSEVGEPYLVPLLCYSSHGSMKKKEIRMSNIPACSELNSLPRASMES